ncbi:MAG: response regulator [Pseudomonadales bacterium]|nr:response regulator [Pseudomonadales bacterium]
MTAADHGSMWLAADAQTSLPVLLVFATIAGTLAVAAGLLRDARRLPVACLYVVALALQLPLLAPGLLPQQVLLFSPGFALCLLPIAAALLAALVVQCMPDSERQQALRPLAITACVALAIAALATLAPVLFNPGASAQPALYNVLLPVQLAASALIYIACIGLAYRQFKAAPDFIGPLLLATVASGLFVLRATAALAMPALAPWPVSLLLLIDASCASLLAMLITAAAKKSAHSETQIRTSQNSTTAPALRISRHDLRAPLSDIVGLAELITDQPLDKQQREYLVMLNNAARRALQQVNELYRIPDQPANEADQMQAAGLNFRPEQLIEECCQQYSDYMQASATGLVVDIHQNVPRIMRGEHMVLRELISLCLKLLFVECKQTSLLLDIAAQNKNRLLVRFLYHAPAAIPAAVTAGKDSDTLSAAMVLAREHGGSIERLKADPAHASRQGNPASAGLQISFPAQADRRGATRAASSDMLTGQRVLVVDDSEVSLRVISAYLNRWALDVYTADTASHAGALIKSQHALGQAIDAAIIDFRLPDATGLEFVERLISDQAIVPLPAFILMSNSANAISARSARNHGIHHVLEKPVLAETLQLTLLESLFLRESISDGFGRNQAGETAAQKKLRVLLVEDDPISRKVTGALLRAQGWDQDNAMDAASAIAAFEKSNYDIVILDCNLPDSSGFDLASAIRRIEKNRSPLTNKRAKLYSLSADDDPLLAEASTEAKLDGHLVKPVTAGDLEIMQHSC